MQKNYRFANFSVNPSLQKAWRQKGHCAILELHLFNSGIDVETVCGAGFAPLVLPSNSSDA